MLLHHSVKDKTQNNLPGNQQEWTADHGGSSDGASVVRSRQSRHAVAESAASEKESHHTGDVSDKENSADEKSPKNVAGPSELVPSPEQRGELKQETLLAASNYFDNNFIPDGE